MESSTKRHNSSLHVLAKNKMQTIIDIFTDILTVIVTFRISYTNVSKYLVNSQHLSMSPAKKKTPTHFIFLYRFFANDQDFLA